MKQRRPTRAQLEEELAERRRIGRQMSNALFNLAQIAPTSEHTNTMRELSREWDAIARAEAKATR